jgi:hypothetical protein
MSSHETKSTGNSTPRVKSCQQSAVRQRACLDNVINILKVHKHTHTRKRFYRTLSIQGNDLIGHWACAEQIFAYAQPAFKFGRFLHGYPDACWAYEETISSHAEHTRHKFHRMLSIRGNDFIAHWAYAETISSHAEHTRNQNNATNCLERRMGYKDQRLKIGERERETWKRT